MPSHYDAYHGETDEGCGAADQSFEVAGQSAVVADPTDGAFDDPALGQHDKAMLVAASDDLHLPLAGALDGRCHPRPLVAGIANDPLDERELATHLAQQGFGAVAVLYVSRVDQHAQQQAKRIGQDVALATKGLLARVIAGRVERSPPF